MPNKLKNYVFIDSQNLNLSIKNSGWKIDWKKFRVFLKDKYKIKKAFLFIGYIAGNETLYTFLQNSGYVLVFKPTLDLGGKIKGNCDAELVLHCMLEYENFDKAIIVSGDGDFHCLIEYLAKEKKLLKIGIPDRNHFSSLLIKYRSPYFFYVADLRKKIEYKKG